MDGTGENIIDDNMLNDIGIISTQAMEKINKKFS